MLYRPAGVMCLIAGAAWAFVIAPRALGNPVNGGMNFIFGPVLLLVLGVIWVTSPRADSSPPEPAPAPAPAEVEDESPI